MTKVVARVALALVLAVPMVASAAQVSLTLGFIPFGNGLNAANGGNTITLPSSSGTNVLFNPGVYINTGGGADFTTANGFAIPPNSNAGGAIYGGVYQAATPLTFSGGNLTNGPISNFFGFGGANGDRFQFTLTSATETVGAQITIAGSGTLYDLAANYDPTPAAFTLITSGGVTSNSNYSVSFAAAPAPVPLPAAAWLLFSGLGMLGAAAKRKTA